MVKGYIYKDSEGHEIYFNDFVERWVLKKVKGVQVTVLGRYEHYEQAKKALDELKG